MDIKFLEKSKNKEYVVILPKADYDIREGVDYTFDNVIYLEENLTEEQVNYIINFVNEKLKQIILFDYDDVYRKILPYIRKSVKVKWVLKYNLACMTDGNIRYSYTSMVEFYDRNIVDAVGCLDKTTYTVLKNAGYNAYHVCLDIKNTNIKSKNLKTIGLLGNDYNPNHNTYNQLSALRLVDYEYLKMIKVMNATREFISFFDLKNRDVDTLEEVMKDNMVNLYCNFTATNNILILKSMDMGVPCILGNSDFFNNNKYLKENLVLISDDDISEIADKINFAIKNSSMIMDEYKKFRKEYINILEKNNAEFIRN